MSSSVRPWRCLLIFLVALNSALAQVGPVFPITASWFKDRFSKVDWNETLSMFKQQGGDTVYLRAPAIVKRTLEDLRQDPQFSWCGNYNNSSTGTHEPLCFDEAVQELTKLGLKIKAFATYQYEEDFSEVIMLCPAYDRKISSSRTYFRIVLPVGKSMHSQEDPCKLAAGSEVVVLFTSFSGTDPHYLLVETASTLKMKVHFGVPALSVGFELLDVYFQWVDRVLMEHKSRYSRQREIKANGEVPTTLYDTIAGYYGPADVNLGNITSVNQHTNIFKVIGSRVKALDKKFTISPSIDLTKNGGTVEQHVQGLSIIAKSGAVDILAIREGRGSGKGCYYWPHEANQTIKSVDPDLDAVVHYVNASLKPNVTFSEVFSSSTRDLFFAFQEAQNNLAQAGDATVEIWLNLEAFEYLRDDPCLPIDPSSSGVMGQILNRASKATVFQALRASSSKVNRVIATSWDPDFTCSTKKFNQTLHQEIMSSLRTPLVANCSFHNAHNLSVVVLGYNLSGPYTVEWTDTRNRSRSDSVYGYYFELDYGQANRLVGSLQYSMLWDISSMMMSLAPTGTVKVTPEGQDESCFFQYDLPYRT